MPSSRHRTVLVVEDDPSMRRFFRTVLTEAGFRVTAVEDGHDALSHLEAGGKPAAVLLDWALPRVPGPDLLADMRANPVTRDVPVVVVTGTGVPASEVPAECLLRKPVAAESVVSAIEACIDRQTKR